MFHAIIPSPVGELLLAGTESALKEVRFAAGGMGDAPNPDRRRDCRPLREAARQLGEYFAGKRQRFELPLAPDGTVFQRKVWAALQAIPYGETRSYGDIAEALGKPKAAMAVGGANGSNPLPILIPCHRVIGADGSLTGYGGGLEIKRFLLELELGSRKLADQI